MPRERTGLLIIRAWVEPGSAVPLRADIRRTEDVEVGFTGGSALTLTDIDAIGALVQAWLQEVLAGQ